MAFEYTPYRSPFVGAIADLIGQRGDIAAQQALNEAKVRSQAVSSVAQSLGNLAQYQADAPKRRLEQATLAEKQQQLADAQAARAGKQSLATLLSPDYVEGFQPQGPTPVDASGEAGILPKSPSLVKNIGGVKQLDPDAIQAAMGQLGHGAWFLENRNTIDNLNKSMLERHVLGQKAIQNAADLYVRAARQSETTLDDRFKTQAAQTLVDALDNIIPSDQLEAIQKALVVGDTRMVDQFARQYATPDKIEMVKTGPGEVVTPVNQFAEQVGPAIKGAPVPPTSAQLTAEVRDALRIPENERTPNQQATVRAYAAELKLKADIEAQTKNKTPQQAFLDAATGGDYNAASLEQKTLANQLWRDSTQRERNEPYEPTARESHPMSFAIGLLTSNIPRDRRESVTRSWNEAVRSGDTEQQKNAARSIVRERMTDVEKRADTDRNAVIKALGNIRSALDGVPTNIAAGTLEDVRRWFGTTSKDNPRVAALKTRFDLALQNYTHAVSGAQFTEKEFQRYSRDFPSMKNVNALNATIVDTLLDVMKGERLSAYETATGGNTQMAEWMLGNNTPVTPNAGQSSTPPPGARIREVNPVTGKLEPQ